ncbi:MAG TPA: hypothetical protein VFG52_03815, partial [Xanthomonadales bacterium]|nr:hypothetical protein [Xanthomonadales bacterium]
MWALTVLLCGNVLVVNAAAGNQAPELDEACVMQMANEASAGTTLAEVRRRCQVAAIEEAAQPIHQ